MGRASAALILVLASFAPTSGQDRPQDPGEVSDSAAQDTAAAQDTLPQPPARRYEPAAFSLTVTAGLPGSGEAQSQPVLAYRRTLSGAVLDSALLNRTVRYQGGISARVSGELGLSPAWVLRLGAGVTTATLQTSYSGDRDLYVLSVEAIQAGEAELRALSLESAIRYRIPSSRRLQPYLEFGAVYSRWSAEGSLSEVAAIGAGTERFEALAGVGGVVPLNRTFSARLHLSTRVFRNPVPALPAGDTVLTSSALALTAQRPPASAFADADREMLSLLRLELGLSLDLQRPAANLRRPAAPPDTTSPPGR